jgi:hypothetical protein
MSRQLRSAKHYVGGHAIAETIIGMLAFAPLMIGIPLLGKQLDIKQKTYEGARYDVWERTVWQSQGASNVKSVDDIARETQDRILGNPRAGLLDAQTLQDAGATQNYLWRDRATKELLHDADGNSPIDIDNEMRASPVEVGKLFVKSAAYGSGAFSVLKLSGWKSLGLTRESFVHADVSAELRPVLQQQASVAATLGRREQAAASDDKLTQAAHGGILTDTWSSRDEKLFRKRVGNLTLNEAVWTIETPGMALGVLGSKGNALTGEAQFGWGAGGLGKGPDLTAPSTAVPPEYQHKD